MIRQFIPMPSAIMPEAILGKSLVQIYGDLVPEQWIYGNGWVTRYARPSAPLDLAAASKEASLPLQQRITTTLVTIPVTTERSSMESMICMLPDNMRSFAKMFDEEDVERERHWLMLCEGAREVTTFVHVRHQPLPSVPPKVTQKPNPNKPGEMITYTEAKQPNKVLKEVFTIPTSPDHLAFLLDKLTRAVTR